MIRKLIDSQDLTLLEIDRVTICGKRINIEAIKDLPEFVPIIIVFLSDEDNTYEKIIRKLPDEYGAMIFPVKGKAYAAFFPTLRAGIAYGEVMACIGRLYPDPVYAHEFKDLNEIEDLIKAKTIPKTKKSSLYKKNNKYWYVTSNALFRLNEYFANPQRMQMSEVAEHCEKLIGEDAYEKILSYVKGVNSAAKTKTFRGE